LVDGKMEIVSRRGEGGKKKEKMGLGRGGGKGNETGNDGLGDKQKRHEDGRLSAACQKGEKRRVPTTKGGGNRPGTGNWGDSFQGVTSVFEGT